VSVYTPTGPTRSACRENSPAAEIRPAGSVSTTVSSTGVPAGNVPFGLSVTGLDSVAWIVSPFFSLPESMLRESFTSIAECGGID
jgi:hypothetical protein